jgi:hypothetical protein
MDFVQEAVYRCYHCEGTFTAGPEADEHFGRAGDKRKIACVRRCHEIAVDLGADAVASAIAEEFGL